MPPHTPHSPTTHHPIPPVLFLICMIGVGGLDLLLPGYTWLTPPWTFVGVAPIALGIGLALWAEAQFKRAATPVHPGHTPIALVTNGPFKYSRNPMYVSLTLILIGVVLLTGNWASVATVPMFVVAIQLLHIRREERIMRGLFGEEYEEYCRRVRGWV